MAGIPTKPPGIGPASMFLIVFYGVAIFLSIIRLWHRINRRQAHWDDLWVAISVVSAITLTVMLAVTLTVDYSSRSDSDQSWIFWSGFLLHPIVVWATRISNGVTLLRFIPPGWLLSVSKWSCWIHFLMLLVICIQKFFMCEGRFIFNPLSLGCVPSAETSIMSLVLNFIANVWQVGWPTYVVLVLPLPQVYRKILIACASTSIVVGTINVIHYSFFLVGMPRAIGITGHLEAAIALLLVNALVVVASVYRAFQKPEETIPPTEHKTTVFCTCGLSGSTMCMKHGGGISGQPISMDRLSRLGSTFNQPSKSGKHLRTIASAPFTLTSMESGTNRSEFTDADGFSYHTYEDSKVSRSSGGVTSYGLSSYGPALISTIDDHKSNPAPLCPVPEARTSTKRIPPNSPKAETVQFPSRTSSSLDR